MSELSSMSEGADRTGTEGATDHDVLIVGWGPVGETLAILLAQHGHRVGAVERFPAAYPRPRAVHFDDEIARVFASAGVAEEVLAISERSTEYDWQNAAGETLLHFDWGVEGPSGWTTGNMFAQPELERALDRRARSFPNVAVSRGEEAVSIGEYGDRVTVTTRRPTGEERTLTARYLVGCDGANSFVRGHLGTGSTDLGFFYDWLICDVRPHEARVFKPFNLQICDPVRPTTVVSGGPGRRRWEFMRLPTETIEELNTPETAWRLLEPFGYTPDNAELERHTVYTFQARWADEWRRGRILLAGDAAHLMPPFAGQGMCSGVRDAANLAWKLDLVLRGVARPALLDTYTSERSAHIQHAIGMSVALGNVICLTDPVEVAARDERMLAAGGRPEIALGPVPEPVLGPGVLATGADGSPAGSAGTLSAQGRVSGPDGRVGRFDEIVGHGFVVVATADPTEVLSPAQRAGLERLGTRLVHVVPAGTPVGRGQVGDVEDFYLPHLREAGHAAAVVRPDFYLYGAVRSIAELPSLVDGLLSAASVQPAVPA